VHRVKIYKGLGIAVVTVFTFLHVVGWSAVFVVGLLTGSFVYAISGGFSALLGGFIGFGIVLPLMKQPANGKVN
jgi:hypothetical protein